MGSSNKKLHVYVNDRVNHIIQDVWDGHSLTTLKRFCLFYDHLSHGDIFYPIRIENKSTYLRPLVNVVNECLLIQDVWDGPTQYPD